MAPYETVTLEIDEQVSTITLDRPEKKNAMSPQLHREMRDALGRAEENSRVLVITGNGDAFCGGMDLEKYFLEPREAGPEVFMEGAQQGRQLFKDLYSLRIPTVAKINGWTFGAGYELQGVSDIAIASEEATFGLSEINFDIFPAGGTMWTAVHTMNRRKAMYYAATGQTFTAEEAEDIGAITEAVPTDELDQRVAEDVDRLLDLDPTALWFNKDVLEKVRYMEFDEAVDYEVAKLEQMNYLQGSGWVTDALPRFADRKFRPGLGTYDEEE